MFWGLQVGNLWILSLWERQQIKILCMKFSCISKIRNKNKNEINVIEWADLISFTASAKKCRDTTCCKQRLKCRIWSSKARNWPLQESEQTSVSLITLPKSSNIHVMFLSSGVIESKNCQVGWLICNIILIIQLNNVCRRAGYCHHDNCLTELSGKI